ncbi:hypothetical protein JXM67_07410 [candidate division WOR-3 bacterium]|nr:hypothetical protein [candidate division WOR-3 bacterium]
MANLLLALILLNGISMEVEWSEKTIHFYGPIQLESDTAYFAQLQTGLDSVFATIPFDAEHSLAEVVKQSRDARNYFSTALVYPQVVSTRYSTTGEVQNEYVLNIIGPYIEELIPRSSPGLTLRSVVPETRVDEEEVAIPSIPNTGFVIDARGTGFRPGVFPRLLDTEGNVIFDPGKVDRSVLRERGYVQYAYSPREALETRELGLNPLRIVAERSAGSNQCDLILPAVEAEDIINSALNLRLLSECRVMIIIDRI